MSFDYIQYVMGFMIQRILIIQILVVTSLSKGNPITSYIKSISSQSIIQQQHNIMTIGLVEWNIMTYHNGNDILL